MNLLYGEMLGSAIIHAVAPMATFALGSVMVPTMTKNGYIISLIAVCTVASFIIQFGFLSSLQQSACSGIKSMSSIAGGSLIAALITAAMIAIPVFVEPMRLMVTSVLGMEHKIILEAEDERKQDILVDAAEKVWHEGSPAVKTSSQPSVDELDIQTRREMAIGSAFWLLFAGAYGVGAGAMTSTSCGSQAGGASVP